MEQPKRAAPRVLEHVERLRMAGLDTARFFDALTQLRDDRMLPKTHKVALTRLIAMESFIWYMEALRNERIDRMALREAAIEIAKQHEVAIRKQEKGAVAAELARADLGKPKSKAPTAGKPASNASPRKKAPAKKAGPRRGSPRKASGPRSAGPRKRKP